MLILHFTKISKKQTHFPRRSILGKKNTAQRNGQPIATTHRKKYISDGVIEAWSSFVRSRGRSRGGDPLKHSHLNASKYSQATVKISFRPDPPFGRERELKNGPKSKNSEAKWPDSCISWMAWSRRAWSAWSSFARSRGRSRGGAPLKHSLLNASKYFQASVKISLRADTPFGREM